MWAVFDVMGVLVRERHVIRNLLHPLCMQNNLNIPYTELKALYNRYVVGKITRKEFNEVVPVEVEEKLLNMLEPEEEILELIERLRADGWKIGIITNLPTAWAMAVINRMRGLVDVYVISAELGVKKPDRIIYEAFLKKARARPEEVVFIDDKLDNLEAASELGMKTVLMLWEPPDAVATSAEELREIFKTFYSKQL